MTSANSKTVSRLNKIKWDQIIFVSFFRWYGSLLAIPEMVATEWVTRMLQMKLTTKFTEFIITNTLFPTPSTAKYRMFATQNKTHISAIPAQDTYFLFLNCSGFPSRIDFNSSELMKYWKLKSQWPELNKAKFRLERISLFVFWSK